MASLRRGVDLRLKCLLKLIGELSSNYLRPGKNRKKDDFKQVGLLKISTIAIV